jgi:DNA-binding transcriptional regulator GbsR (MarR family)
MEERRRREIEPTLSMLREALMEVAGNDADRVAQDKMRQMHELIELTTGWLDEVQRLSPETVIKLMQLGAKVQKVLEFADRLKLGGGSREEP